MGKVLSGKNNERATKEDPVNEPIFPCNMKCCVSYAHRVVEGALGRVCTEAITYDYSNFSTV